MHLPIRTTRGTLCAAAFLAALAALPTIAHAQGCVTAHGSGLPKAMDLADEGDAVDRWDVSVSYRWFTSDRHYVGTAYQAQRDANHDQVINHSNFVDIGVNYAISPRFSATLIVPFVAHDRSQVVKDPNGVILDRYHTQAAGLSDVSLLGGYWIFNPATSTRGNLQVSLGAVLPTGNSTVTDTFEAYDKVSGKIIAVRKPVDDSIQPGLGGYGINVGLNGYRVLGAGFTAYGNASYTITPQQQDSIGNSISDTYIGRGGLEYALDSVGVKGVTLSLGLRAEGVAVYDLMGGSLGHRRPGYSVAIEPGIGIIRRKWSLRLYVPVAIQRDRLQSYPDKLKTWATGVYTQGDAAFANYLVEWSYSYRF